MEDNGPRAAEAGLLRALKELYVRVGDASVGTQAYREAGSQDLGRTIGPASVMYLDAADQEVLLGGFRAGRAHYT